MFGGVVQRELPGLQFGDEMSAVGRGGGEDVVELSQPLFELVDCTAGDFDGLVPVAACEPGPGLAQGLRQQRIREGANGVGSSLVDDDHSRGVIPRLGSAGILGACAKKVFEPVRSARR